MPIVKYRRAAEPLWHEWDRKAQKHGLRHTVYGINGDRYTGEWSDNLKHGKGTQLWKHSGAVYSGDWKCGKRDGHGSYSVPDPVSREYRKVYAGCWRNDRRCGYGTMFYSSGERYEGEWSSGLRSGWGRMCYRDGSIYEGQWVADRPDGQGMLRLSNSNRYEGGWKDGKKHGPGRFFYLDKRQLLEGIWVADVPKCGTVIDLSRDEAPAPTRYPIPKIELADPDGVLAEAQAMFGDSQNE
ncbi:hypothetical protein ASZ78_002055 [Callipepla squamata]|uniref:MORN repeat-containing protein 3 n=1 Tax=Callipepla squamata TaxID=9009 RepID=A0A226N956_CALSU|nr:hypothetical protein ASZ78_002055 [Callipepla squamata]